MELPTLNITQILDLLGTFAFAISGIRLAANKNFDWFGAYVVGLVTAIGGGTTRDLLLDVTPFWMVEVKYVVVTGIALLTVIVFQAKLLRWGKTLFLFDTIGLGLFTISGIERSLAVDMPFWVCILMGAISGSVGGVIRDIIINEIPLLFREDLYAIACIVGGIIFFGALHLGSPEPFHELIAAASVIAIRLLSVKYGLQLPKLRSLND